ncbi:uncharacterized protein BX664DRAFT_348656 [Halteromyces radiatus]|uniref:uncharacterized protein n=1 Tax=Halteromyces radiatus TaxID=101107 RepID=UPI00221E890D|nr:uncharacterized protein BX664DRAFT_348656 [Halteromyces radiatus]KAI8093434.1 hypothetical protein BX664DRAFT_348656 [Halteromyces radiatus]
MESRKQKIEQMIEHYVAKAEMTSDVSQRQHCNDDANQIHEQATGHPMTFDKEGHLDMSSPDAKKCPALQRQ